MSMFSIASCSGVPGRATVASNGYGLTTATSIGAIAWAAISCWCAGVARPSKPPWIRGCRVLTRPSRISGAPVYADTWVTGIPGADRAAAVPPVDRISPPSSWITRASSITPVLSWTENSARTMAGVYQPGRGPSIASVVELYLAGEQIGAELVGRRRSHLELQQSADLDLADPF